MPGPIKLLNSVSSSSFQGGSIPVGWSPAVDGTWLDYRLGTLTTEVTANVVTVWGQNQAPEAGETNSDRGLELALDSFGDGASVKMLLDGSTRNIAQGVSLWLRRGTARFSVIMLSSGLYSQWTNGSQFSDGPAIWDGTGSRCWGFRNDGGNLKFDFGSEWGEGFAEIDLSTWWISGTPRSINTLLGGTPTHVGFGLNLNDASTSAQFVFRASCRAYKISL